MTRIVCVVVLIGITTMIGYSQETAECQNTCVRQLCVANEITDDVCAKQSAFGIIARQEFNRTEPVILILPVRSNLMLPLHTEDRLIPTFQNSSPKYARSRCLTPALISAAPHYGLRYGSAPATGNFQRLRGRPPLVSPLKSCMSRSFTAVTCYAIAYGNARVVS